MSSEVGRGSPAKCVFTPFSIKGWKEKTASSKAQRHRLHSFRPTNESCLRRRSQLRESLKDGGDAVVVAPADELPQASQNEISWKLRDIGVSYMQFTNMWNDQIMEYDADIRRIMLKLKSRHVAGTVTKKEKNMVLKVIRDILAWQGQHLLKGDENRRYYGLKTEMRVVECLSQRDYDLWTKGVSRVLAIAA